MRQKKKGVVNKGVYCMLKRESFTWFYSLGVFHLCVSFWFFNGISGLSDRVVVGLSDRDKRRIQFMPIVCLEEVLLDLNDITWRPEKLHHPRVRIVQHSKSGHQAEQHATNKIPFAALQNRLILDFQRFASQTIPI